MLKNLQMILENSKVESTSESLPLVNTMLNDAVFRPMLFSTPMVQALLEGRKTQTRRLVKFPNDFLGGTVYSNGTLGLKYESKDDCENRIFKRLYPKFNIGDIIWVRETHVSNYNADTHIDGYIYKASYTGNSILWTPSLFMKKDACRLWLKVTDVRAEPLHNISETDAINEGIFYKDYGRTCFHNGMMGNIGKCTMPDSTHPLKPGWSYQDTKSDMECLLSAKSAYANLWEKINGKGSWGINPWVFVYDFEVTTERPFGFI